MTDADWQQWATVLLERSLASSTDTAVIETHAETTPGQLDDDGPFAAIVASAELTALDAHVLALCGAVELDRRLQRLVGRLTHDDRATRVDLDLLARLLGRDAVATLADDGRLVRAALLSLEEGPSLAAARIVVPRRVTWALLDDYALDPDLPAGTELVVLPPEMIGTEDLVLVHGVDPVRRAQTAVRACAPIAFLLTTPPADDLGWQVLVRQATVGGLGVVLDLPDGVSPLTRRWVDRADHLAFALCSADQLDLATAPSRDFVELAAPAAPVTDEEWHGLFPDGPPARRPTAQQLRLAGRLPDRGATGQEVMRRIASGTLLRHAKRVVPTATWDDLVLPPLQARQLRSLVDRYQQRSRVHDAWGLPLYPSPGVVALFSGPSGTGKTTTAEVIAAELGVELFRVDLSALVSKYIGETEKHLEEIFSAAHTGNYLLLFDEADSLFGSRSKVNDARDRYANLEVSYLLQRLETYDGFVVLTSNFQGNIDPAFLRRIHLTVHFTVPSAVERERIWERALGRAPVEDLDLAFVAEQFDLTGGSIRNAALGAAFAAAAGPGRIQMPDLLTAVAQELTKLGRRPNDAQFGRWLPAMSSAASEVLTR